MSIPDVSPIMENPTWDTPIRHFFNQVDIAHMLRFGIDLGSYESVTSDEWREAIWERVSERSMPIAPSEVWTDEMIFTYRKWLDNGFPRS
ncbi:MAG TPA: hypothetical protein VHC97_11695 [Thermoanaerobaculia bacterium]|jgi:hypothetical protein|nr:hypothetical protein [Thermoanaerobaculia bacterium]